MRKGTTEEVEDQSCLWPEGLEEAIRERVRQVIEAVRHEEVEEALGARRSQRTAGRCGYRHGRKARALALRSGAVSLVVPRAWLVNFEGDEREWRSALTTKPKN
jgi:putative transposase